MDTLMDNPPPCERTPHVNESLCDNERMRAITVRGWGDTQVLTATRLPRPKPGPGEVLVRVHVAGVNATDWKSRASGGLGLWNKPVILGHDVSGVVADTGIGVTLFRPGDEVFGMPRFPFQPVLTPNTSPRQRATSRTNPERSTTYRPPLCLSQG